MSVSQQPTTHRSAAETLRRFVLTALVVAVVAVIGIVALLRLKNRDVAPLLTPDAFYAAQERAKRLTAPDYDIEVHVRGTQPAKYRVEVRNGIAQAAWRNGQPLNDRRTFATWSVPGIFATIGRDIESVEKHAAGKADPLTPRVMLRAIFDTTYGYPAHYRRVQQRSTVEVTWDVTKFQPSAASNGGLD
jgi:hypothetical protein